MNGVPVVPSTCVDSCLGCCKEIRLLLPSRCPSHIWPSLPLLVFAPSPSPNIYHVFNKLLVVLSPCLLLSLVLPPTVPPFLCVYSALQYFARASSAYLLLFLVLPPAVRPISVLPAPICYFSCSRPASSFPSLLCNTIRIRFFSYPYTARQAQRYLSGAKNSVGVFFLGRGRVSQLPWVSLSSCSGAERKAS